MIRTLQAWLNGTKDYKTGLALLPLFCKDKNILTQFAGAKSVTLHARLHSILKEIYLEKTTSSVVVVTKDTPLSTDPIPESKKPQTTDHSLSGLYKSAKSEADKAYKENMNTRAVLFSMVPTSGYEQSNAPDMILARQRFCISVVQDNQKVSALYDKAAYVLKHGYLPDKPPSELTPEQEVNQMNDHEIKAVLDNRRKARNKLKIKELTPERIDLINNHNIFIDLLEKKWHSLKQKK